MKARFRSLLERRFLISTQLYIGMGGAVLLTIAACLVGWFSFNSVGETQSRVNEGSVPELAAAFGVAQYSGILVAAAPRLTSATTAEEFERVAVSIDGAHAAFEEQLAILERGATGIARFERIRTQADSLFFNIEAVKGDRAELFALAQDRQDLESELAELHSRLDNIIVPAIDDQLFYTMTGYRSLEELPEERSRHFSEEEFAKYRYLAELQSDANTALDLLETASTLSEASLVETLRERFESAESRIHRDLTALQESPLHSEIAPILARLFDLEGGEQSGFDLVERELRLAGRQRDLLELNRDIAINLVTEVDVLVSTAEASAAEATQASAAAILTGRTLLLSITAISIGGALLIAWLFVGRVLLYRLERLSVWMRRMAGGDLEARVDIGGRDEVAEMAAALEVFRLHAIEIQRLNLVEQLAEELQGKNTELEAVLGQLRHAQDQIVAQEKLAALGELTAGVAHEIRNPLNFVKNFSESSGELLAELQEILTEEAVQLSEEQRNLVDEIAKDLSGNLERIRMHGERADRIVHDMLQMGRGSGGRQPTDINNLLDEHSRLAYHSARATDNEFQLNLKQDFDPNMGEVEVIPQDLGRVFLNMVSNACYATDERRRAIAEGGDTEPYEPTIFLTTRRREDSVEVRIKDNGMGIPADIVDKIFNPFFTTKPPDQGTGLGLAMSSDIVRGHGGSIRVESEPGQFTEMIIELPLEPPAIELAPELEEGDGEVVAATPDQSFPNG